MEKRRTICMSRAQLAQASLSDQKQSQARC